MADGRAIRRRTGPTNWLAQCCAVAIEAALLEFDGGRQNSLPTEPPLGFLDPPRGETGAQALPAQVSDGP